MRELSARFLKAAAARGAGDAGPGWRAISRLNPAFWIPRTRRWRQRTMVMVSTRRSRRQCAAGIQR